MDVATKPKKINMGLLNVPPLNPALAVGSFAEYPCLRHTAFWGTYDWPHDCFDPWDRKNPRHFFIRKAPVNIQRAEDFINIYKLRHLLYERSQRQPSPTF
jgi:hypothetical protein